MPTFHHYQGDKMIKVYLASGWFNDQQMLLMNEIHNVLLKLKAEGLVKIFAPFWDGVVLKPTDPPAKWKEVFDLDVGEIWNADLMVANIEGFEPGTIFETGVAFAAETPVIAYSSVKGRGLNLMLAQSSIGFANSPKELEHHLRKFIADPTIKILSRWEGEPI
jgi:nucleoside 2-deoxyribosyltransferase